jgi:hypothetical protein
MQNVEVSQKILHIQFVHDKNIPRILPLKHPGGRSPQTGIGKRHTRKIISGVGSANVGKRHNVELFDSKNEAQEKVSPPPSKNKRSKHQPEGIRSTARKHQNQVTNISGKENVSGEMKVEDSHGKLSKTESTVGSHITKVEDKKINAGMKQISIIEPKHESHITKIEGNKTDSGIIKGKHNYKYTSMRCSKDRAQNQHGSFVDLTDRVTFLNAAEKQRGKKVRMAARIKLREEAQAQKDRETVRKFNQLSSISMLHKIPKITGKAEKVNNKKVDSDTSCLLSNLSSINI